MPAVIPWVDDVLQKLVSDPDSCIFLDQKRIQVVLQPFHLQDLKSAVRDLLNESVDSYHKSLNGILLSYKRLKVVNKSARVAAETSGLVLDVEADFYVFRPEVGSVLKGVVNKVSNDHVGALLHHRFNISCPRPSVESKSVKWLGNKVVMSQEVIIKVKEKDFAGKMPFFKGKLLEIGRVLAEEERKSNKKKKAGEASIVEAPDTSEPSSTPTPKKRKLKLEETQDEIKVKKSKKEPKTDDTKSSVVGILKSEQILPEKSSAKKKKKMSVGSIDDVDFIPRLSLDVSQLPEDLPPPNADSTHFDLAKANSSLTGKSEKKKKTNLGLSAIREESTDGAKGLSSVNNMNLTGKSQKSIEEKTSKKKKKDEVKQNDADGKKKLSKKEMSYESSVGEKVQDQNPPLKKETKAKKSKELLSETSPDTNTQQAPSKSKKKQKEKGLENASLTNSSELKHVPPSTESISSSLTKKEAKAKKGKELQSKVNPVANEQHASDAGRELQTPSKSKKKQKEKALDSSSLNLDREKKPTPASADTTKDSQSSSKSKKKLKEEKSPTPPTQLKKKKDRELHDILTNDCVDSDDTIPPGQKLVRESPVKQVGSSGKRSSLSVSFGKNPEISYFSAGDNVMNLGSRKGDRQTPLMFGTMDGKVIPPPESPVKRSPAKNPKYSDSDSDSDAPSPKKMAAVSPKKAAVLSPVKREIVSPAKNTKTDDSDSDSEPPSPRKVVVTSTRKAADDSDSEAEDVQSNNNREQVYDSDDSDQVTSAQNKLLQSMGVMQSPLKSARPNVKQDSSDSDSDGSTKANNTVSPGQSKSSLTKLGNGPAVKAKSKKNMLANSNSSEKNLPLKAPQATKSKATKTPGGKKVSAPAVPVANDTDSGDSDLDVEVMRRALLAAVTEPTKIGRPKKGTKSPAKATPAKNTPKKPKPIAKSTPEPVRGVSQNLSVDTDSDSGPDDRNTTILLSEIRERKESELKGKKKTNVKQVKGKKALVPIISEDSKKDKSEVKEPKKKQETKGKGKKKPSADEEISDVMQRLLQQAKLNIGMT